MDMDNPQEPNVSQEKTPASPRKGILDFIQSLKKPSTDADKTAKPSEVAGKPLSTEGALYHHFKEFGWSVQQNIWLKLSLIVHLALVILIWFGFYLAWTRPTYLQIGATSLNQASKNFFANDYTQVSPDLLFDNLSFFTISTLTPLYQLDVDGANYLKLLQGMVNPDIIQRAQKNFDKNQKNIASKNLVQNLTLEQINAPIFNAQTNTIALFVGGYLSLSLQDDAGNAVNRITPYRAKLLLQMTPVSLLDPFPFFLEELTDTFGAEACKKWDKDNEKFIKVNK
jgi:hypothetical protein